MYSSTETLPIIPPLALLNKKLTSSRVQALSSPISPLTPNSPIHEGLTPLPSHPGSYLSLQKLSILSQKQDLADNATPTPPPAPTVAKIPPPPKRKPSKWVLFRLWMHTYRKFFIVVVGLNLTGIIMASLDKFPYAKDHSGALVLGNLLCAVMFRNELFLRFLYMVSIYGLRFVSVHTCYRDSILLTILQWAPLFMKVWATSALQHVGGIHSGCALSGAG